jgi:uncharacterized RmlC-like cupin family protein
MPTPIVAIASAGAAPRFDATGTTLAIREWRGSGPAQLHVHHEDDEAWHVLEGTLRFRFLDEVVEAPAGSTVFVPAGAAHTFEALSQDTRYLVMLTPRLLDLIAALQKTSDPAAQRAVYRRHASELVE